MKKLIAILCAFMVLFACNDDETGTLKQSHRIESESEEQPIDSTKYGVSKEQLRTLNSFKNTLNTHNNNQLKQAGNAMVAPLTLEELLSQVDESTAIEIKNAEDEIIGYAIAVYVKEENIKKELYMFNEDQNIEPFVVTRFTETNEILKTNYVGEVSRGPSITHAPVDEGSGGGGSPMGGEVGCGGCFVIYRPCKGPTDCNGDGIYGPGGEHSYEWGNAELCGIGTSRCVGGSPPSVECICFGGGGGTGGGTTTTPGDANTPPDDFDCVETIACVTPYENCVANTNENCWQFCGITGSNCSSEEIAKYNFQNTVGTTPEETEWFYNNYPNEFNQVYELVNSKNNTNEFDSYLRATNIAITLLKNNLLGSPNYIEKADLVRDDLPDLPEYLITIKVK